MHGGLIHVAGSAGHLIGSAYRGSKRGMTDGTILIGGDVGSEIGAAMRRGTLAVGGSCGDAAGFSMIAGTILVFGELRHPDRRRHEAGDDRALRRGAGPSCCPPSGAPAASDRSFSASSSASWPAWVSRPTLDLLEADLLLYHGDLVALGKGEVWMRGN